MNAAEKLPKYLLYALLALALAAVLVVRIRLLPVPLERDEGEFAYLGQLMLRGLAPFGHAYSMKIPGAGVMYALFMLLFGQSATAIHLGLLLVNLACVLLVWLLARRLLQPEGALAAAACFALMSLSQSVFGVFAHATHFVVLFALAGTVQLGPPGARRGRLRVLAAGLFFGTAFVMKQHALFFFLFAAAWLSREAYRGEGTRLKRGVTELSLLAAGMLAPYLAMAAWMAASGSFGHFWFWTVTYARDYATGTPLLQGLATLFWQTFTVMLRQFPLWLIAAAGALFAVPRMDAGERFFLLGFLFASFLAICPGLYFREHYYVMLLPAAALCAGAALDRAAALPFCRGKAGRALPAALLIVSALYVLYAERSFFFSLSPLEASRATYGSNPFPEAVEIARYIREHSSPGDRIAVVGSEPEIYFYANRLSATGYLYMYGLTESHDNAQKMQRELVGEIEGASPAYLVLVNVGTSWLARGSSADALFDWCERYAGRFYDLVGVADIADNGGTRYRWGKEAEGYHPGSDAFVTVFKRKNRP